MPTTFIRPTEPSTIHYHAKLQRNLIGSFQLTGNFLTLKYEISS